MPPERSPQLWRVLHAGATANGSGRHRGAKGRGSYPLLAAALEGIRRFGHHISVEYFADLSALLARLLRSSRLTLPLRLQCLATGVHVSRRADYDFSTS